MEFSDHPRANFQKSTIDFKPIIVDVEASGFGRGGYPIEVGVAFADGSSECMIIRPESDWLHWDEQAEQLHGIDRQVLINHGKPVDEVALWLNNVLGGEVVYSDAWGNDSCWLALIFDRAKLLQRFKIDSLLSLLSEHQVSIWHSTKQNILETSGNQRHRASYDACIIQKTFCQTISLLGSPGNK